MYVNLPIIYLFLHEKLLQAKRRKERTFLSVCSDGEGMIGWCKSLSEDPNAVILTRA